MIRIAAAARPPAKTMTARAERKSRFAAADAAVARATAESITAMATSTIAFWPATTPSSQLLTGKGIGRPSETAARAALRISPTGPA